MTFASRSTVRSTRGPLQTKGTVMAIILLALLVLVLFGAGFTIHLLWIAAVVFAVVWVAASRWAEEKALAVNH